MEAAVARFNGGALGRTLPSPQGLPFRMTEPLWRAPRGLMASTRRGRDHVAVRAMASGGSACGEAAWRRETVRVLSTALDMRNSAIEDGEECEVVNGCEVLLGEGAEPGCTTGTGGVPLSDSEEQKFGGYMVYPLKNSNGAGVLLLSDVLGYSNPEVREFAHRIACFGYNVLVPDLFRGVPWDDSRPKEEFEEWRLAHAGPPQRVAKDVSNAAQYLKDYLVQEDGGEAADPKIAAIGFCFGGGRVLEALARDGARSSGERTFFTGVSFYGTRFDPATVAASIKVPVLFIAGDTDPLCPVDSLVAVADLVEGSQVQVYPGRGHAFAHRPASMDEDDDAEKAFQSARHWLFSHLRQFQDQSINA